MTLDFLICQILFKGINKKSASALQRVSDESLDQNLELELRGRIISVKSQMDTFNYFCGVTVL